MPLRHIFAISALRWIGRILLRALLSGLAALALHGIFGLVHWYTWQAYVVIGCSFALAGGGSELVWEHTAGHMVRRPRSAGGVLSRLPFWFFAGGCGYTAGMLAAKNLLLLGFYDIPVKPIFLLGSITGCVLFVLYEFIPRFPYGNAYDPR